MCLFRGKVYFRWVKFQKNFRASRDSLACCIFRLMAFIRKFETGSGATGVQVCYKEKGRVVKTIHIGSASSPKSLEKLLRKAQDVIDQGKNPLFDLDKIK